uniref:Putative ovule protein n=1 Tax=Solanum chacoense TaxID=4108 RepID=A0A0V0HN09_SOLCH
MYKPPGGAIILKSKNKFSKIYNWPITSTTLSTSPTKSCLHQKNKRVRHLILIVWELLVLPSKHLPFLSFHSVHQMQAGTFFHQSSFDTLFPIPCQCVSTSKVVLGIVQLTPSIQTNMFHRFVAILQCRNKWPFTSAS